MRYPRKNLNRCVPWRRLFDVFGVTVRENTLPAVLTCPLCSGPRLTIFSDHVGTGQWHYCPECGSQGDMIELAMRFWKLSLPATMFKLHDAGFQFEADELTEDSIANYRHFRINYRDRISKLWKKYRGNLLQQKNAGLFKKLYMRLDNRTVTHKLFTDLVGSVNAREFEKEFFGLSKDEETDRVTYDLFKGGQWDRALILPFYDRPFRLSGFYFAGRDGIQEHGDRFFRHTNNHYSCGQKRAITTDAGLYFHPSTLHNRRAVIAINDPLRALHLHLKQINCGMSNLANMVVWQHAGSVVSRDAWDMFRGRKLIFWMEEPDYRFFAQVIRTGGLISTAGPKDRSAAGIDRYLCDYLPDDIVRAIEYKARPWSGVFDEHVAKLDDNQLENLLLQLRLCEIDIFNALHECCAETKERARRVLSSDHGFKSAQWTQGMLVEERNDCWYALNPKRGTEYMLSNAVLQIDSVVVAGERMRYVGKIRYKGQVVEFEEDKKVLDRLGAVWLENKMVEHRLGVLRYDRCLRNGLTNVAKLFVEPKLLHGYKRVGWDDATRTMVLPTYGIKFGGAVQDVSLFCKASNIPGEILHKPTTLLQIDIMQLLFESAEYEYVWATWCGLVANVLAPAFNRQTHGLAAVGRAAAMSAKIASMSLGCASVSNRQMTESYLAAERAHLWPAAGSMDGDAIKSRLAKTINAKPDSRNILLRVSPTTADVLLCNGGWLVTNSSEESQIEPGLWEKLARIFPAYMRYLLQRRFADFRQHPALVDDVAADLTYWFSSEYEIETSLIIRAVKKLQFHRPGRQGSLLLGTIAKLVDQGRMVVVADGDSTRSPKLVATDKHLVVSLEDINRALARFNVPTLHRDPTAEHLHGVGAVEVERDGLPTWHVPLEQWNVYRVSSSPKLKVFKGA